MSNQNEYLKFLETKKKAHQDAGFEIQDADLNPALFDFQRHIVKTALKKGRYAIFADCGLGKTLMQLEWARHVSEYTKAPVLILCPLQLPTIQRALHLWSNEGDTVLSPFAGIGSELYQAVKMNRRAIGFELKKSYFDVACSNLASVEQEKMQMTIF